MERDELTERVMGYIREHWSEKVREEWRLGEEDYGVIVKNVLGEWTMGASRGRRFLRVAGLSGTGKTTQLLPAAEAWFEVQEARPVVIAARRFVEFHPFVREIEAEYGAEQVRKMTDGASTVLMFLVLRELIRGGYDVILDVALLDPVVEGALMGMLMEAGYEVRMSLVLADMGAALGLAEKRRREGLEGGRVVDEGTVGEFGRAMQGALEFYGVKYPEMPVVVWGLGREEPALAGEMREVLGVDYEGLAEGVADEERLRQVKVDFMKGWK